MQSTIEQFLNNNIWTEDKFQSEERINCNFIINILNEPSSNLYEATVQIVSSRPVYNSSYESVLLNHGDREWVFEYYPSQNLEFSENQNDDNSRPAIFAFNGDVYDGLDVKTLDDKKIDFLQNKLRIISGLYGVLKPLDLIQPYRLEMGTKISINGSSNLYEYWSNDITKFLSDELLSSEFLLNLASNEYFEAFDKKKFDGRIISPVFKDFKNGKLKICLLYTSPSPRDS